MDAHDDVDGRPEAATWDDDATDTGSVDERSDDPTIDDAGPGSAGDAPSGPDRALRDALSGLDLDYLAGLRDMIGKAVRPSFGPRDALARQQASWAKTFVVPDLSSVKPKFDLPKIDLPGIDLPGIDLPRFDFPLLDVAARQMSESLLAGLDFGSLLPKLDFGDLFKFEPSGGWDRWWANWWPPNWPRDVDLNAMQAILNDEGLPLVWVPRAEIVTEVLAAGSREERVAVLVARRAELGEDCRGVLVDVGHPRLLPQRRLLASAVDALAAGHDDAAQSLAVLVAETAVLQAAAAGHLDGVASQWKLYDKVRDAVRVDLDEAPLWLLRVMASLAPVAGFFTPFFPHKGDPVPEGMSRHVTVHFAFDEHYTEEHAVVAVLLMASVVRGLQQGWEFWEPDAPVEPEDDAEDRSPDPS